MNLTITPLIRIAALIGLIAIVALGGSVVMLGRSHTSTPPAAARHGSAPASARRVHVTPKTTSTTAASAHTKTKTTAKSATPAGHAKQTTPSTAHKAATHHKAVTPHKTATQHKAVTHKAVTHRPAKFRGNPVYADLPPPLQWELAHHKVVVVSFYNPNAQVDAISVAEAHAGAVEAGAGFLLVSVLDNKVAGILTALLPDGGLLPEPGVIIYHSPGTIAVRLDGFTDRDSVAQAASNAFLASAPAATATAAPAAPAATAAPAAGVIVTP